MKGLISKLIVGIFRILVPLFYVLFIFAGLACALVTSVIGYQTVIGLFPKNASVGFISIPFLIVVSFEVTKVFIIFLNKQYSDSLNAKYIPIKSLFLTLRVMLIVISGIFTLLYTFYNLDNPELDSRLQQQKTLINSNNTQQRVDINATYDRQNQSLNVDYDNQIQPFKDEMKAQENFRYSNGEFRGPEWKAANENITERNNQRNTALASNEAARIKALNDLNDQNIKSINETEKKLKMDNSSSNKMVNSMLEVITFNPNYGKGYYIFTIFILSILISVGLEFVIWGSFTVLAIEHGDFFTSEMKRTTLEQQVMGVAETADVMNTIEIKSMKKRFQEMGDTIVNMVKKKSKENIEKAKKDLINIDED